METVLTDIIQKHVFVGVVDLQRSLSLLQHETKLYLVNQAALASATHPSLYLAFKI